MDKLSGGLNWLLLIAAIVAVLVPCVRTEPKGAWIQPDFSALSLVRVLVIAFVIVFALGWILQLSTFTPAAIWFLGGLALSAGLHHLTLTPLSRGAALLLVGFLALPNQSLDATAFSHICGWLSGLLAWKLCHSLKNNEGSWEDFLIPATYLVGTLWLSYGNTPPSQSGLLPILLSIALLLRSLQLFNLPLSCPFACGGLLAVVGGLAGWLALQTLIPQLHPLSWILLFAGGILLAFMLNAMELAGTPENPKIRVRDPNAFSRLVLIGLASLVASRLFGTMGWLVLASAILVVPVTQRTVAVAGLFWLGRVLLQGFLSQFNPNVTGINIVHPYATAALYAGLIGMLALPLILEGMQTSDENRNWRGWTPAVLLILSGLLVSGLANFFLHSEATGSLLVAALVGGVGVSMLYARTAQATLMAAPLWLTCGCLLLNELIDSGNSAEKGAKIAVLVVAMLLVALLGWLNCRLSGCEIAESA